MYFLFITKYTTELDINTLITDTSILVTTVETTTISKRKKEIISLIINYETVTPNLFVYHLTLVQSLYNYK